LSRFPRATPSAPAMPLGIAHCGRWFYALRTEREGDHAVALDAAARRQLNTDLQLASRSSVYAITVIISLTAARKDV
jgi:hypothetical protein